jgi:6-phosphogluconolactonase
VPHPFFLALTPDGRFLLCANMPSNNLVVFRIDAATGRLIAVGRPAEVASPSCIMIVPQ